MIRVLVADDSATVRALLVEMLRSDPEVAVVGEARDGLEAVEMAERLRPDLVTMDIHMPGMDGLEATREIMIRAPTRIVIVTSAASGDVELSLCATRAGALTVLATPGKAGPGEFEAEQRHFLTTIRAMARVKVVRRWRPRVRSAAPPGGGASRLIAIAASTGGPAAVQRILIDLPAGYPAPILVTQHISPGFVEALCAWLSHSSALRVKLAEDGEELRPGTVYLAPDERHLGADRKRVVLSRCGPIDGHCPSATFLFRSVARSHGAAAVGVVLTGMGNDGVEGLRELHRAGGRVIAQDEESCIVYGMPREAIQAGVVDAVLPIHEIPQRLITFTQDRSE